MKDIGLLVWMTQLGFSVVCPLAGFILLAVWLHSLGWGAWVIWTGVILGGYCAVNGFLHSLRTMDRLSRKKEESKPPVSFNDHE